LDIVWKSCYMSYIATILFLLSIREGRPTVRACREKAPRALFYRPWCHLRRWPCVQERSGGDPSGANLNFMFLDSVLCLLSLRRHAARPLTLANACCPAGSDSPFSAINAGARVKMQARGAHSCCFFGPGLLPILRHSLHPRT